jgi:hypothetical protein
LLLENHQVVTRLQLDNFHWEYVWGPAFFLLVLLTAADAIVARKGWSTGTCATIGAVATLAFSVGVWIRAMEATRCPDRVENDQVIAAYRAEFGPGSTSRFIPNAVAAGEYDFIDYAVILSNLRPLTGWAVVNSPSVRDAEVDERAALNDILLDIDRLSFEASQRCYFDAQHMGPMKRSRLLRERFAARLAYYDRCRADLPGALNRFGVRYVALRSGTKPRYLHNGWTLVFGGPTWDVWERITNANP